MTSSTPINAATDGMITSTTGPMDPVARLRRRSAWGLIAWRAMPCTPPSTSAHEIHTHIYKPEATSAAESQRKLLATPDLYGDRRALPADAR